MAGMRTPAKRVRGLGTAHEGTQHFWLQRLTAVANVPLMLFLVGLLVALNGADYATVRGVLGDPTGATADEGEALLDQLLRDLYKAVTDAAEGWRGG